MFAVLLHKFIQRYVISILDLYAFMNVFEVSYVISILHYITLHRNYLKSPMVKKLLNDCPM